jgi:hypothetical protein
MKKIKTTKLKMVTKKNSQYKLISKENYYNFVIILKMIFVCYQF